MTAMTRAGALRGFPALVRQLGGDADALLRRHRLSAHMLDNEDALFPSRAGIQLLEDAAQTLRCADFGLRLAQVQDISTLGPLAIAIQHARSVREAALSASRYIFVQGTGIAFTLLADDSDPAFAELRFDHLEPRLPNCRQSNDLAIGLTHRIIGLPFGGSYPLDRVYLPHEPLAPVSAYARFFGAPLRFAAAHAALRVPVRFLDEPLPATSEVLRTLAVSYLEGHFSDRRHTLSARVRLALAGGFDAAQFNLADAAALLALHPRTLQRQLADEGTRFEAIRDQMRQQAALRYLASTELALTQVATLIGLSEQSALTRCCQRWFGKTPTAIRREAAAAREAAQERAAKR